MSEIFTLNWLVKFLTKVRFLKHRSRRLQRFGPKENEFRDPLYATTEPQKAGIWEKVTRLEEALTQGTTVPGLRGPIAGQADRKRASVTPPKQVLEDNSSVAEQTPSELKEQIIRKETTFSKPNRTS